MVGEQRWNLVHGLQQAFGRVSEGGGSEAVILIGDAGQGKTLLVQEFYRWLAATQADPHFWPARIVPEGSATQEMIAPLVEAVAEGALPEWLWLPYACRRESSHGRFANVLPAGSAYLQPLAQWVAEVEYRQHRFARISARGRAYWPDVFSGADNLTGLLGVFGLATGIAYPAGVALTAVSSLGQAVRVSRSVAAWQTRRRSDQSPDDALLRAAAAAADHVVGLSRVLPVVVAIEDLHDGDALIGRFIRRLLARGEGRVLVIATGWPTLRSDERPPASAEVFEESVRERVVLREVEPLGMSELRGLALSLQPNIDDAALDLLIQRYASPHTLREVLRLPDLNPTRGPVSRGVVERIACAVPNDIREVLNHQWRNFGEDVRKGLSALAEGAPGQYWHPDGARAVLERLGMSAPADVLTAAEHPYRWLRQVTLSVEGFVEMVHRAVAKAAAVQHWEARQLEQARSLWIEWYEETRDQAHEEIDSVLADELRREHVRMADAGRLQKGAPAVRSASELVESDLRSYRYEQALATAETVRDWLPRRDQLRRALERQRAWALDALGARDAGIDALDELVETMSQLYGEDNLETLEIREQLAALLCNARRFEDAIGAYSALVQDRTRRFGPNDDSVLRTRRVLAAAIFDSGRWNDGIAAYESVYDHQSTWSGSDSEETLNAAYDLGGRYQEAQRFDQAEGLLQDLVRAWSRTLGVDHPKTADARQRLGSVLVQAERPLDALRVLRPLTTALRQRYGHDDPWTIQVRALLGVALGLTGQDVSLTELRLAVSDAVRVLGQSDEGALNFRYWLGWALHAQGDFERAADEFRLALDGQTRVLGEDHLHTLMSRHWLGTTLYEAGKYVEAEQELRATVEGQLRVLGAEHPETLLSRHWLGEALNAQGDFEGAADQFRLVVDGRSHMLGERDPDTLVSRHWLGTTFCSAGRYVEAEQELRATVDSRLQVLGAEHPDTLMSRHWLGEALNAQGDFERAADEFRLALDGQTRVLGEDHLHTLMSRHWLGTTLYEAGKYVEAEQELRATVEGQLRVLGAEHPETLLSRHWLGEALNAQGDFEGAADQFRLVVDGRSHMLGEDHPETVNSRAKLRAVLDARCGPEHA